MPSSQTLDLWKRYPPLKQGGFCHHDYKVWLTLTRPKYNEVPNVITCCGRNIYIVVEGRRPNCGDAGHLAKLYPCKNPTPEPQISKKQPRAEEPSKTPCSFGEMSQYKEMPSNNTSSISGRNNLILNLRNRKFMPKKQRCLLKTVYQAR